MAETLVYLDGFDEYGTTSDWIASGWSGACTALATGNVGGKSVRLTNTQRTRAYTADKAHHVMFYWQCSTASNVSVVWACKESATIHGKLNYLGDGTFGMTRNGTSVGTKPISDYLGIAGGTWYHIEIIYYCDNTSGGFEVYVNGELACTSGGYNVDTQNGGSGTPNVLALEGDSGSWYFDDLALYTGGSPGTQIGPSRVITEMPTGDGALTDWTPSTGSRYTCVDEIGPNTTDYISDATVDHRNTFTKDALGVTGIVRAVAVNYYAEKDDAATRSIRGSLRIGSTNHDASVDQSMGVSYSYFEDIWEQNPDTSGDWTVSDVDAAEFGVRVTA